MLLCVTRQCPPRLIPLHSCTAWGDKDAWNEKGFSSLGIKLEQSTSGLCFCLFLSPTGSLDTSPQRSFSHQKHLQGTEGKGCKDSANRLTVNSWEDRNEVVISSEENEEVKHAGNRESINDSIIPREETCTSSTVIAVVRLSSTWETLNLWPLCKDLKIRKEKKEYSWNPTYFSCRVYCPSMSQTWCVQESPLIQPYSIEKEQK